MSGDECTQVAAETDVADTRAHGTCRYLAESRGTICLLPKHTNEGLTTADSLEAVERL